MSVEPYRTFGYQGRRLTLWRDCDPGDSPTWGVTLVGAPAPQNCIFRTQSLALLNWSSNNPPRGKKQQHSFKLYDDTFQKLQTQAQAAGRTVTAQLEYLIEQEELLN